MKGSYPQGHPASPQQTWSHKQIRKAEKPWQACQFLLLNNSKRRENTWKLYMESRIDLEFSRHWSSISFKRARQCRGQLWAQGWQLGSRPRIQEQSCQLCVVTFDSSPERGVMRLTEDRRKQLSPLFQCRLLRSLGSLQGHLLLEARKSSMDLCSEPRGLTSTEDHLSPQIAHGPTRPSGFLQPCLSSATSVLPAQT